MIRLSSNFACAGAVAALAVCALVAAIRRALRTRSRSRSASAWRRPARSAPNGQQALLGMKIWEEETNAKGGLLGRPVKLVYYDDQSNPSTVPGIYTKLLDVDKVDLVLGGYATNMVAPAMPVIDPEEEDLHQPVRARGECRIPLPEIFLGAADRAEDQGRRSPRDFSRSRRQQNPKPTDGRFRRGGRRVLAQRLRRRAQERQGLRRQDRLRQELSAGHDRLLADGARACRRPMPTSW